MINNDILTNLLSAFCFKFIIEFYLTKINKFFYLSITFGALSSITKINSLVLFAVIGIVLLYDFISNPSRIRQIKKYIINISILTAILLLCLTVSLGAAVRDRLKGEKFNLFARNTIMANNRLFVENKAQNYLWFDLKTFITQPYTSAWDDNLGRKYELNYLLKTSLFGEWQYDYDINKNFAIIISFILILMILYMFSGFIFMNKSDYLKNFSIILIFIFYIILGNMIRIASNGEVQSDFRYIFPVIIPFCYLYGNSLLIFTKKNYKKLEYSGYILAILFASFCFLFYLYYSMKS
jgi:hypothetical protein